MVELILSLQMLLEIKIIKSHFQCKGQQHKQQSQVTKSEHLLLPSRISQWVLNLLPINLNQQLIIHSHLLVRILIRIVLIKNLLPSCYKKSQINKMPNCYNNRISHKQTSPLLCHKLITHMVMKCLLILDHLKPNIQIS